MAANEGLKIENGVLTPQNVESVLEKVFQLLNEKDMQVIERDSGIRVGRNRLEPNRRPGGGTDRAIFIDAKSIGKCGSAFLHTRGMTYPLYYSEDESPMRTHYSIGPNSVTFHCVSGAGLTITWIFVV